MWRIVNKRRAHAHHEEHGTSNELLLADLRSLQVTQRLLLRTSYVANNCSLGEHMLIVQQLSHNSGTCNLFQKNEGHVPKNRQTKMSMATCASNCRLIIVVVAKYKRRNGN